MQHDPNMSTKPNLQPHFLINVDSVQSGKTGHVSFVDGKKVAWLASKQDMVVLLMERKWLGWLQNF